MLSSLQMIFVPLFTVNQLLCLASISLPTPISPLLCWWESFPTQTVYNAIIVLINTHLCADALYNPYQGYSLCK